MKVEKGIIVTLEYLMKDPFGKPLESSDDLGPMDYLQGFGNMLPGVEKKLEGAGIGEEFKIVVQPEDGYGLVNDELIETFPKTNFDFDDAPEVGMEVLLEAEGEELAAVIENISDDEITLNANHPMAGIVLHFDVKIKELREATEQELEIGQPISEHDHH